MDLKLTDNFFKYIFEQKGVIKNVFFNNCWEYFLEFFKKKIRSIGHEMAEF